MFPLTRPVRQGLATLILVVFTVLPTVYVAYNAWRIHQPAHLRDVEAELGRQLGVHVTLEGVSYPRPAEVRYRGVVLRQEEPRRKGLTEVARAHTVRLRRADRELVVEAEGLRLRGESPKLALAQVGALLQRTGAIAYDRITLSADVCDLELGSDRLHVDLREVAGTFQADSGTPTLVISYRLASKGSSTRCELTLTRDRKAEPVKTSIVLKTMEGLPLPARVLDVFFDAADWLGPEAKVEGELALRQEGAKDWEADFQGNLLDVDLSTLLGLRFPSHRLSGRARVTIPSARWAERPGQGFGWVAAKGELTAGQGTIGLELLNALAKEMKFRLSPRLTRLEQKRGDVAFQALGLTFAIAADGQIEFGGGLGDGFTPGAVLAGQTTPLVYAPQGAANVRGLIKTLVPVAAANTGVMVPLTPESRLLMSLPVPPDLASTAGRRIDGN
ncbi:MAG: hypothetical protein P4L84_33120 [Isosphaeraceae bacterium]|nr:hypothetical protein [Isosphaeraceae bacterium]